MPTSENITKSPSRFQVLRKTLAAAITRPIIQLLAKTGVTPNMVTWSGFVLILAAAILAGTGKLFAAGWVMLASGFLDIIDGALARGTNKVTRFGAVLDSTLDRASESIILLGIAAYYLFFKTTGNYEWIVLLIGLAITGSFLVSYVRARAEGIGLDCQVGMFTRAERVIILALGLLFGRIELVLVTVLAVLAVFSLATVVQRMVYIARNVK